MTGTQMLSSDALRLLPALVLLLLALPVAGQQRERPNERMKSPDYSVYDRLLEEEAEDEFEADIANPTLDPPAIAPEGWVYDYNYRTDLFRYLAAKQSAARTLGRDTYVYLYADQDKTCLGFRKTAGNKDYQELFENRQIVMVEYLYLKRKYRARFKKLPVFLKVHDNGVLGPESVRPIGSPTDHPRKAYHKLKKFFQATADAG